MIQIHMDRAAGSATFDGITKFGSDPWRQLCQALRNIGHLDTDILISDERGVPCLTVRSIHACARNQDRRDAALAKLKQRKIAAVSMAHTDA